MAETLEEIQGLTGADDDDRSSQELERQDDAEPIQMLGVRHAEDAWPRELQQLREAATKRARKKSRRQAAQQHSDQSIILSVLAAGDEGID